MVGRLCDHSSNSLGGSCMQACRNTARECPADDGLLTARAGRVDKTETKGKVSERNHGRFAAALVWNPDAAALGRHIQVPSLLMTDQTSHEPPAGNANAVEDEFARLKASAARLNLESMRLRQESSLLVEAVERLEKRLHHEKNPRER